MFGLEFRHSLLLAPLAYAIHHAEEHLLFNFREWRLRYFADNNALSTEAVFMILSSITILFILLHQKLETRATAWSILLFLMASQVVNTVFHVGGTVYFNDFSPGFITGILVYLPVNFLIARAAIKEGLVTVPQLAMLFVAGAGIFTLFEIIGPVTLLLFTSGLVAWIGWDRRKTAGDAGEASAG